MKMRILISALILVAMLAAPGPILAQPADTTNPTSYSLAMGGGFSRTANPQAQAWASFSYCTAGLCPYTAWTNLTGQESKIVAGVRKDLATQGPLTLFALADAGAATTASGAVGFTGGLGGGVDFALGQLTSRLNHCYLIGLFQGQKSSVDTAHAAVAIGIKYKFESLK